MNRKLSWKKIILTGLVLTVVGAGSYLMFTTNTMVMLMRHSFFNSFELEGDEIGKIEANLVYKTVDGEDLMVDLYMPTENKFDEIPVVVFSHGGGWLMGDRNTIYVGKDNYQLLTSLRSEGYAVANYEYRKLSDDNDVHLDDMIADTKDIVRWLRQNADTYNLATENIGLWGQSAGGHLVLMAGLTDDDEFIGDKNLSQTSAKVSYIVDNYGATDLVAKYDDVLSGRVKAEDDDLVRQQLGNLSEHTLETNREAFIEDMKKYSPTAYIDENDPPVLMIHGDKDTAMSIEQSEILHAALNAVQVPNSFHTIHGANHQFAGANSDQIKDIVLWTMDFITENTKK